MNSAEPPSTGTVAAILATIIQRLEAVEARIALLASEPAGFYDSKSRLPPGVSKRAFNERCRGGTIKAVKEGRIWRCAATDWHAPIERPAVLDIAIRRRQALERAGFSIAS